MKKLIYPCLIREEDNVYYAEFPDFESCFTDGETFDEAVANAKDLLEGILVVYAKQGKDFPVASRVHGSEEARMVLLEGNLD
ncbi:type II toxin-antitoxin system HicB family antitoxin [Aerococcus sanguinicola]|uniref:Type II toxin-antitoxin system HicB family antitoxin n=1 Tax=Aerococcus sanguinicola TaxID=119206 RepID=A0A109REF6_9LACT|nr:MULTISPECIES: type II toxin-antitoxin system HicB family antitoxin [Aerococcus]AMB93295.1 hypothetical protein AWM72_00165 [Aerococcus sanguinicola]MDK7049675.1 type II toxin-antitoxin system HicB family antitoxin [Aerococcus sanguinicola]OFT95927.1 hypothetical protein HMPREF3090_03645 [Aerococcus sp. HMSC23C02]PKZ23099.1 type II toxin-antitoxin system HicB family antitoxin [Aerococcus sanguinicola]